MYENACGNACGNAFDTSSFEGQSNQGVTQLVIKPFDIHQPSGIVSLSFGATTLLFINFSRS